MKILSIPMSRSIMVALAGLLLGTPALAQFGGAPTVEVAAAELREMAPAMQVAGTVLSRSDAVLSAEIEGRLLEVADVGTRVDQGEVIARVEDTALKLRVSELEAELASSKARLSYLEASLERQQRLAETNLASASQIDETRSERDIAQAQLSVIRSRLDQLNDQIERTRVRAPFPGVVVERIARAGERVATGAQIARLVNPDRLEAVARAPLRYFRFVTPGSRFEVDTGGEVFDAPLRTVVSVGNEDLHVFELRLDIERALAVGQTVRVTIPTAGLREVLAVPRDALVLRGSGTAVFIIDETDTARRASVTTGIGQGEWIEVAGPVQPGDRVVIRGNERLRDGQSVDIAEFGP